MEIAGLKLSVTNHVSLWLLLVSVLIGSTVLATEKMPADVAGTIGEPSGQIAFIRDKNVWVMDYNGTNQRKICEVGNAEGRLSWAPDGRRIVFSRVGQINKRSPDNMGGMHKLYDLFVAFLDSADAGNTLWWRRLTEDLGARSPEWTFDDKIIYMDNILANTVNSVLPNYQISIVGSEGGTVERLRKDWQNASEFLATPTMNRKGDIAFVHFYDAGGGGTGGGVPQPQGIAVLSQDQLMMPMDSIRKMSIKTKGNVGPAWSPDDKWLAYVSNSLTDPGLFVTSPDFKQTYSVFVPPPGLYMNTTAPSFSPDSKWLTFATSDGSVWICKITGEGARRVSGPGMDSSPAWWKGTGK